MIRHTISKPNCPNVYFDGAGHYCKLIPMDKDKDYPHKHWRVMCFGRIESLNCEAKKRSIK